MAGPAGKTTPSATLKQAMKHTLTRWNPLRELEEFQNRILGAFPRRGGNGDGQDSLAAEWMPLVDIAENDQACDHQERRGATGA